VLEEMRQAGVEPNVVTYSTLMQGFVDEFDSSSALSVFENMIKLRVDPDNHSFSILFSGLVRGINGDARAGSLKIIEIFTRYLDMKSDHKLLNHFVAGPVLRALASCGSVSDVDSFWMRCQRVLAGSRDGWPGAFLSKQMCDLHARSRLSTAGWERLVSLCSTGSGGGGEATVARFGTVVCNNWAQHGSCHFGEGCRYKDGHSGLPSGGSGNKKNCSAASSHVPRFSVVCNNWEKYGSCHFGDGCRYKEGHDVGGSSSRGGGGVAGAAAPLLSETSHSRGAAVVCNSWQLRGSCKFGDECRFKAGHR
jgi:pentatricopeptide repeat protein